MRGPSFWREPPPAPIPRRGRRDYLLVGAVLALTVVEGLIRPALPAASLLLSAGFAATLRWRRERPLLMVALSFGTGALIPLLTQDTVPDTYTMVYLLLLPYALTRWGSGREITIAAAVMLGCMALSALTGTTGAADSVGAVAVVSAVAATGLARRYRVRARTRELEQVRLMERERLARDLHDTVAHHVSAIAVRAQAGLAAAPARPEAATEALRVIEAEASRALAEMRAMVRVLRQDEPAAYAPSPTVADLRGLARPTGPGLPVDVHVDGDLASLPAPLVGALFRMAQESVTNALRHARQATRVEVRVSVGDDVVRLRVDDDGTPAKDTGGGFGLTGMGERARLLDGVFRAGPAPAGGWSVAVELPLAGPAR
ncbi:sensor histidine kinase [Catellatospora chokoriensis]|uniref:histidine kinase n=1 Tax=Catellatospora chokoriensis TaxID=310353 RepID=A0A8J3K3I0_9ACTN|nr:histidine kinase [Catellatospora chokoriensis]GIF92431.1 two-component sensor histidine kinase [Catellatospora chokoriensis]